MNSKFRCPGEVFESIANLEISEETATKELKKYRKLQRKIQDGLISQGCKDEMPPCYDCRPKIFKHCQDSGIFCMDFEHYANTGEAIKYDEPENE